MSGEHSKQVLTYSNTQLRILHAAEKIFAERGIEAASLRTIVRAAGVNLAAVRYHFGSKGALAVVALERIVRPIANAQIQHLTATQNSKDCLSIEDILRAFFASTLREVYIGYGESGRIRACFIGRCYTEPSLEKIAAQELLACRRSFIQAIQQALPGCSKPEIEWKLDFVVAILIRLFRTSCESTTLLLGDSVDEIESTTERLIKFTAAGFKN